MLWILVGILLLILLLLFRKLSTGNKDYFKRKGLVYSEPKSFIGFRTDVVLRRKTFLDVTDSIYREFRDEKISGVFDFGLPIYIMRDPVLLKKLTVTDFGFFPDHNIPANLDPLLSKSLFGLRTQKWRDMRATLSPCFTASKMRLMHDLMSNCIKKNVESIKSSGNSNQFEAKQLVRRFLVDLMATCMYGIEVNSFKEPENDFYKVSSKTNLFRPFSSALKILGNHLMPSLMKKLKVKLVDDKTLEYFHDLVMVSMKLREDSGIIRNDMIQLLMLAKKNTLTYDDDDDDGNKESFAAVDEFEIGRQGTKRVWDDDDLIGQAFLFFHSGVDAVSTAISTMVYELIRNPDVQQKLQVEFDDLHQALNGRHPNYEQTNSLKFLDQVVSETLRKWPLFPIIERRCNQDYEMNFDGKQFTIESGKVFYIPIYGIHHDEKFYVNPEKFDPERFSKQNRASIVPDTYLPFGIGPRNCIASRFALVEIKTIIYYLLLNFNFESTPKTDMPIKIQHNPIQFATKDFWFALSPRR